MLDEKKIRLMTDLARYENQHGKEELKISRYYRSDYLGLALFKNFFLASIAYLVILGLIGSYFLDYFLDNIHRMNILLVGVAVIGGYIITLTIYSVVTYAIYSLRYSRAQRSVRGYEERLEELEEYYREEEMEKNRKQESRRSSL